MENTLDKIDQYNPVPGSTRTTRLLLLTIIVLIIIIIIWTTCECEPLSSRRYRFTRRYGIVPSYTNSGSSRQIL